MKSYYFLLVFFFLALACNSQSNGVIPQAVIDSFQKKYPKEKSPKWEMDGNGYFEAVFKKDGEKYRADFTLTGKWVETESSIKFKELPEKVQQVIKDRYDKKNISEIERVEHHSKGLFYDVEFKSPGKNIDVEINANGEVIN